MLTYCLLPNVMKRLDASFLFGRPCVSMTDMSAALQTAIILAAVAELFAVLEW